MPARNCSITAGRALQYVRAHETPRVADTFHLFLLSLYESLAQAANPPAEAAPAGSHSHRTRPRGESNRVLPGGLESGVAIAPWRPQPQLLRRD